MREALQACPASLNAILNVTGDSGSHAFASLKEPRAGTFPLRSSRGLFQAANTGPQCG